MCRDYEYYWNGKTCEKCLENCEHCESASSCDFCH